EAGLFQQSWNSHTASPELPKLFDRFKATPAPSLQSIFREGAGTPSSDDLQNYGSGNGAQFQALCKAVPMFAVEGCAGGLRVLRPPGGPISKKQAEVGPEAEDLLLRVQGMVDAVVIPTQPPARVPQPQAAQPDWGNIIADIGIRMPDTATPPAGPPAAARPAPA